MGEDELSAAPAVIQNLLEKIVNISSAEMVAKIIRTREVEPHTKSVTCHLVVLSSNTTTDTAKYVIFSSAGLQAQQCDFYLTLW